MQLWLIEQYDTIRYIIGKYCQEKMYNFLLA